VRRKPSRPRRRPVPGIPIRRRARALRLRLDSGVRQSYLSASEAWRRPRGAAKSGGTYARGRDASSKGGCQEHLAKQYVLNAAAFGWNKGPFMALRERISEDLKTAMKARDEVRVSTLRLV